MGINESEHDKVGRFVCRGSSQGRPYGRVSTRKDSTVKCNTMTFVDMSSGVGASEDIIGVFHR